MKRIMASISKDQHSAIEMVQQITSEVVDDPHMRKAFCEEVRTNILGQEGINIQPYRNVLSSVLNWQISGKNLSNCTLRNATWNILRILTDEGEFTRTERQRIGQKVQQWWGKRGVIASQVVQNMVPLSEEERAILDYIAKSDDSEYKRWTTRNIQKIKEKLEEECGIQRNCVDTIKHYLHKFNTAPKKKSTPRNDLEEIQTLKDLFLEYYNPPKKLPTKIIMQKLNEKHDHNRNENWIEWYIRSHVKTPEQKMKNENPRTDEEMLPLRRFVGKKEEYRREIWRWAGKINRELIYKRYKDLCPETNRTQRALEHKLKSLREKESKNIS